MKNSNLKIIPAINSETFDDVLKKIKLLEDAKKNGADIDWVQIDVADGTFTKNKLWHNPADLAHLKTNLKIEVHLMVSDIDKQIKYWLTPVISRIIFHFETAKDVNEIIRECKEAGKEVGMAITHDTFYMEAVFFKDKVDMFQVLGVVPGTAGQETKEETFAQIKNIHRECPECLIEVDGGMNEKTIKKAVEAGANLIASASAVFEGGNKNIKENIEKLKR